MEYFIGIFALGVVLTVAVMRSLPKKAPVSPASDAAASDAKPSSKSNEKKDAWSSIALPLILLAAFCGVLALWFFFPESFESALGTFDAHWTLSHGVFITVALIGLSFLVPEKAKKWFFGAGIAVLFLSLAGSELGTWAARQVDRVERCLGNDDCGPRAGDYAIIRGGTVLIPRGSAKTFYIEGTVALKNTSTGYCLDYTPEDRFILESIQGGQINYLTPISGERELVSVRSLPREQCYS